MQRLEANVENKNEKIAVLEADMETKDQKIALLEADKEIKGERISVLIRLIETLICSNSVDGGWSQWTAWTGCDKTCGGGNQTRSRECDSPEPQYGGEDCQGEAEDKQECNQDVHCGKRNEWGECVQ